MLILETHRFLWVIHHPTREEDRTVEQFVAQIDDQAHVGPSRFGPGNFVDAFANAHDVRLLIFHPAISHDAAVNTVVQSAVVFDVNFVVPAVVIGIDQMFTHKTAQIMFIKVAHNEISLCRCRDLIALKSK